MTLDVYVLSKCEICESGFFKTLLFPRPNLVIKRDFLSFITNNQNDQNPCHCTYCGKSGALEPILDSSQFENLVELEEYARNRIGCLQIFWQQRAEVVKEAKSRLRLTPCCPVDSFQLHSAAKTGNLSLINLFFETVPIDFHEFLLANKDPSNESKTILIEAAENGHVSVVDRLMLAWQDCCCLPRVLNYEAGRYHSSMALYYAAANGHLGVIRYFLENEPSFLWHGDNADSVLFCAAYKGQHAVVSYLIEEQNLPIVNEYGEWNMAILVAYANNHFDLLHYLLKKGGIDPDLYCKGDFATTMKLFAPKNGSGWGLKFADNFLMIATKQIDEDELFTLLDEKISDLL